MKHTFKKYVSEVYSRENMSFLDYMKTKDFDLYGQYFLVQQWLDHEGYEPEDVFGDANIDLDDMNEVGPALEAMNPEDQEKFTKYAVDWLGQNDPAEAPTWHHMDLNKQRLLPRSTWLVHFSDDADEIWRHGFLYGADDMNALGLTTYYKDSHRKRDKGFNFAFVATSRDAKNATTGGRSSYSNAPKYGKHCVIFQNSGVEAQHYGDEEDQVVFWGEDVNPRDMALIVKDESSSDYAVKANQNWSENKEFIFTGSFEKCVAWVIQNWSRYGRVLNGKAA